MRQSRDPGTVSVGDEDFEIRNVLEERDLTVYLASRGATSLVLVLRVPQTARAGAVGGTLLFNDGTGRLSVKGTWRPLPNVPSAH